MPSPPSFLDGGLVSFWSPVPGPCSSEVAAMAKHVAPQPVRGRSMRIGIVGGLERAQPLYERVAIAAGHTLEYHPGHTGSRGGTAALESLVRRVDLLLIITDVNSHRAVH